MTKQAADWAHMPFFLAVVRTGSLRAAADALGSTHATVDRNLKALEATYGVRFFDRSKSGLSLTVAGEALLPMAEEAEVSVLAARRKLAGLDRAPKGRVRLSVAPMFATSVLPPILARFAEAHPEIEVEVVVENRRADLARAESDVSIRVGYSVDDDVVGRRIVTYAKGIYASRDYLDRFWEGRGEGGEGLVWIGWGDRERVPAWVRNSPFPKAEVRHCIREGGMVMAAVGEGMGISYLPCFAESYDDRLVQLPGTEPELDRSIWLLLHEDLRRTTRVRLLVDHLSDELKALKPQFLGALA